VGRYQREKLGRVKKERNPSQVKRSLEALREAAEGDGNVVPPVLEAVRAYATVGEISDTLRDVFGEYREN
jgi:methylmalonyl-CoA mutase N-terminal domain/subunit